LLVNNCSELLSCVEKREETPKEKNSGRFFNETGQIKLKISPTSSYLENNLVFNRL
jgi:hypothetical protein